MHESPLERSTVCRDYLRRLASLGACRTHVPLFGTLLQHIRVLSVVGLVDPARFRRVRRVVVDSYCTRGLRPMHHLLVHCVTRRYNAYQQVKRTFSKVFSKYQDDGDEHVHVLTKCCKQWQAGHTSPRSVHSGPVASTDRPTPHSALMQKVHLSDLYSAASSLHSFCHSHRRSGRVQLRRSA